MPGSPLPQLTALLLLAAAGAAGSRWAGWSRAVSAVALVGSAVALLALPADATVGGVAGASAFGRGAAWLSLAGVAIAALALSDAADPGDTRAVWVIHLLALGTILASRSPLLLLLMLLLVATILPRLDPRASADGWRRSLAVGGLLVFAGLLAAGVTPAPVTDLTLAGALILGFLLVTGAAPFGIGLWGWLNQGGAGRASAATACLVPALLVALVDNSGAISRLQLVQPSRAAVAIAGFGAATLLLAAAHAFAVRGWHALAADGVLFDIGLALVAVGAAGLDAAALILTVMALTRPLMFLMERLDIRRGWGRVGPPPRCWGQRGCRRPSASRPGSWSSSPPSG